MDFGERPNWKLSLIEGRGGSQPFQLRLKPNKGSAELAHASPDSNFLSLVQPGAKLKSPNYRPSHSKCLSNFQAASSSRWSYYTRSWVRCSDSLISNSSATSRMASEENTNDNTKIRLLERGACTVDAKEFLNFLDQTLYEEMWLYL